jgi:hypothetical protein
MNTKRAALASAVALGCALSFSVQGASAATWTFTDGGTISAFDTLPVAGATVDGFDSVPTGTLNVPYVTLLASYSGAAAIYSATSSTGARPAGDNSANFLVINPQSPANPLVIAFTDPLNTFGYYWGSIDAYNVPVTVTYSNNTTQSFLPSSLAPANGDQSAPFTNGYITFSSPGLSVVSLTLGSTGVAFELDNVFGVLAGNAGGTTPLPAALPLFATGLGALGLMGMRKKRKKVIA